MKLIGWVFVAVIGCGRGDGALVEGVEVPEALREGGAVRSLLGWAAERLNRGFLVHPDDLEGRVVRGPFPVSVPLEEVVSFVERGIESAGLQLVPYGRLLCVFPTDALVLRWGEFGKCDVPYMEVARLSEIAGERRVVTTVFGVRGLDAVSAGGDFGTLFVDSEVTTCRRLEGSDVVVATAPVGMLVAAVRELRARGVLVVPEGTRVAPTVSAEAGSAEGGHLRFDETSGVALADFALLRELHTGTPTVVRPLDAGRRRVAVVGPVGFTEQDDESVAESLLMAIGFVVLRGESETRFVELQRFRDALGAWERVEEYRVWVDEGDLERWSERWIPIRTQVDTTLDAGAAAELIGAFSGRPWLERAVVGRVRGTLLLEGLASNVVRRVTMLRDVERVDAMCR